MNSLPFPVRPRMSGPQGVGAAMTPLLDTQKRYNAAVNSSTARASRLKYTGSPETVADQEASGITVKTPDQREAEIQRIQTEDVPAYKAKQFADGQQHQKDINAANFPVKPAGYKAPLLGGTTFNGMSGDGGLDGLAKMQPSFPGKDRMKVAGISGDTGATGVAGVPGATAPTGAAFPVKPLLGNPSFNGMSGDGGLDGLAKMQPPKAAGGALPFPVQPRAVSPSPATQSPSPVSPAPSGGGRGFAAYMDEQLGGAGWKASTKDSKAGWVAQDGAFRGQTKQAAMAQLRANFLKMTPEQRASYEGQANILSGGGTGAPAPGSSAATPPQGPRPVPAPPQPGPVNTSHPDDDFADEIAGKMPLDDDDLA